MVPGCANSPLEPTLQWPNIHMAQLSLCSNSFFLPSSHYDPTLHIAHLTRWPSYGQILRVTLFSLRHYSPYDPTLPMAQLSLWPHSPYGQTLPMDQFSPWTNTSYTTTLPVVQLSLWFALPIVFICNINGGVSKFLM